MAAVDDPVVVFTGTAWRAEQLSGILENAGIESFLRDEVMGRIDAPALAPGAVGAVKVVVAREFAARAEEILRDFGGEGGVTEEREDAATQEAPPAPEPASPPSWRCLHCAEEVEGQFDVCWNCGAARGE